MSTSDILREITEERERQRHRWTEAHDDAHQPAEWMSLLAYLATRTMHARHLSRIDFRRDMIKVAATAIAAVESFERNAAKDGDEPEPEPETGTRDVVRYYQNEWYGAEVVAKGLPIKEARAICADKEGSSKTCTTPELKALTRKKGAWFLGTRE